MHTTAESASSPGLSCSSIKKLLLFSRYYLPDQFITHLKDLARKDAETPTPPTEETTLALGKYKVKRRASKLSADEMKAQEDVAFKIIAETMKKKC